MNFSEKLCVAIYLMAAITTTSVGILNDRARCLHNPPIAHFLVGVAWPISGVIVAVTLLLDLDDVNKCAALTPAGRKALAEAGGRNG